MTRDRQIMITITGLMAGLLAGCFSGEGAECNAEPGTYCIEEVTYSTNSCGELEAVLEVCNCGCIADFSACKLCNCDSHTGTVCQDGIVYWSDSCGQAEELIEVCECACTPDGYGCEDCTCEPSCLGLECGSDGCGDNDNCGQCDEGWTCNSGTCVITGTCDNGQLETYEECEGFDLRGKTCTLIGYDDGILSCGDDCMLDTSQCRSCGNNRLEPGEECDGSDFGEISCESLGYDGGTLTCVYDCDYIDPSSCLGFDHGCDDGSDCNSCLDCAITSSCVSQNAACSENSECMDYWFCMEDCQDEYCADQCAAIHPDGKILNDDIFDCVICDSCYHSCNGAAYGCE